MPWRKERHRREPITEVLMRHHAFAAAMGLVTAAILAPCSQSQAATADPTGYWYKPDAERESKIQVFKCGRASRSFAPRSSGSRTRSTARARPCMTSATRIPRCAIVRSSA